LSAEEIHLAKLSARLENGSAMRSNNQVPQMALLAALDLIRIRHHRCNSGFECRRVDRECDVPSEARHVHDEGIFRWIMGDDLNRCASKIVVDEMRRVVRVAMSFTHAFSCKVKPMSV
jgi:hypothetical protein